MKKPGGAEKKKVRRSPGVASNGSNSISSTKQGAKDVFQLFAEKARDHKGLVSRWAVLQETRVEYFRGKDFVAFVKNHSELKDILESDKGLEPEDIANILLQKNLLVRCDRVVKIVRPGKKKLSSWPAHLEIYHDQVFSENDAFFAWAFVKRRPLWQTLLSFFWPVLTLAICLFPVYPHWAKLLILYTCAGLLLLILSLLFIRALIFGAIWVLFGKRVWFFPNILAEEATLQDLFQVWPQKDEGERPKWTARLFYAIVAVVVILLLRHHAPDEAARARYQKRVSNIIDDVLEWSPRQALSGMMDTVVNVTDSNDNATDDSKTGSERVHFIDDLDEETDLKEEPRDKLVCVLNCCKVINNILTSVSAKDNPPGADDFLPVLIYVTIKANPPQLHSNLLYIQRFRRQTRLVSEAAYFFTNILSAESFISNIDAQALSMDETEFETNMESARALLSGLSADNNVLDQSDQNAGPVPGADTSDAKQSFRSNRPPHPATQPNLSVASTETNIKNEDQYSKSQSSMEKIPSLSDLEHRGASMLIKEDSISQVFQSFPYLYSQAGDLTVGDIEELLTNYKRLVIKYICLAKGSGIDNPSPPLPNNEEQTLPPEFEFNTESEAASTGEPIDETQKDEPIDETLKDRVEDSSVLPKSLESDESKLKENEELSSKGEEGS